MAVVKSQESAHGHSRTRILDRLDPVIETTCAEDDEVARLEIEE